MRGGARVRRCGSTRAAHAAARDTAIIREQAAEKHLDPALIAAVIYAESKFEPRPSSRRGAGADAAAAGDRLLPRAPLRRARVHRERPRTPRVNVAYGSYYLRYLLDHYDGDEMLAVAAYNGGLANVDGWVAHADAEGRTLTIEEIPFPETREYVQRVLSAQQSTGPRTRSSSASTDLRGAAARGLL